MNNNNSGRKRENQNSNKNRVVLTLTNSTKKNEREDLSETEEYQSLPSSYEESYVSEPEPMQSPAVPSDLSTEDIPAPQPYFIPDLTLTPIEKISEFFTYTLPRWNKIVFQTYIGETLKKPFVATGSILISSVKEIASFIDMVKKLDIQTKQLLTTQAKSVLDVFKNYQDKGTKKDLLELIAKALKDDMFTQKLDLTFQKYSFAEQYYLICLNQLSILLLHRVSYPNIATSEHPIEFYKLLDNFLRYDISASFREEFTKIKNSEMTLLKESLIVKATDFTELNYKVSKLLFDYFNIIQAYVLLFVRFLLNGVSDKERVINLLKKELSTRGQTLSPNSISQVDIKIRSDLFSLFDILATKNNVDIYLNYKFKEAEATKDKGETRMIEKELKKEKKKRLSNAELMKELFDKNANYKEFLKKDKTKYEDRARSLYLAKGKSVPRLMRFIGESKKLGRFAEVPDDTLEYQIASLGYLMKSFEKNKSVLFTPISKVINYHPPDLSCHYSSNLSCPRTLEQERSYLNQRRETTLNVIQSILSNKDDKHLEIRRNIMDINAEIELLNSNNDRLVLSEVNGKIILYITNAFLKKHIDIMWNKDSIEVVPLYLKISQEEKNRIYMKIQDKSRQIDNRDIIINLIRENTAKNITEMLEIATAKKKKFGVSTEKKDILELALEEIQKGDVSESINRLNIEKKQYEVEIKDLEDKLAIIDASNPENYEARRKADLYLTIEGQNRSSVFAFVLDKLKKDYDSNIKNILIQTEMRMIDPRICKKAIENRHLMCQRGLFKKFEQVDNCKLTPSHVLHCGKPLVRENAPLNLSKKYLDIQDMTLADIPNLAGFLSANNIKKKLDSVRDENDRITKDLLEELATIRNDLVAKSEVMENFIKEQKGKSSKEQKSNYQKLRYKIGNIIKSAELSFDRINYSLENLIMYYSRLLEADSLNISLGEKIKTIKEEIELYNLALEKIKAMLENRINTNLILVSTDIKGRFNIYKNIESNIKVFIGGINSIEKLTRKIDDLYEGYIRQADEISRGRSGVMRENLRNSKNLISKYEETKKDIINYNQLIESIKEQIQRYLSLPQKENEKEVKELSKKLEKLILVYEDAVKTLDDSLDSKLNLIKNSMEELLLEMENKEREQRELEVLEINKKIAQQKVEELQKKLLEARKQKEALLKLNSSKNKKVMTSLESYNKLEDIEEIIENLKLNLQKEKEEIIRLSKEKAKESLYISKAGPSMQMEVQTPKRDENSSQTTQLSEEVPIPQQDENVSIKSNSERSQLSEEIQRSQDLSEVTSEEEEEQLPSPKTTKRGRNENNNSRSSKRARRNYSSNEESQNN